LEGGEGPGKIDKEREINREGWGEEGKIRPFCTSYRHIKNKKQINIWSGYD